VWGTSYLIIGGKMKELTLADHAELWWKEKGNVVPRRNTKEWEIMYKKWWVFAFKNLGGKK